MMGGFKVPPQGDFDLYSKLVLKQRDHFGGLGAWAATQCSNVDGLDGLLDPLRGPVAEVGGFFNHKCAQCQTGMTGVSGKVLQARAAYSHSDRAAQDALKKVYPDPLPGFQEVSNLPVIGNFDDIDIKLTEPTSAEQDADKNISLQLHLISTKLIGGELKGAEKVFNYLTGQSLVELLLTPLVGKYGRLKYLEESYAQLSDAAYTVAGNLRKGTWRLGAEWNGDAATAFDSYMFRWHMGAGGLGDVAKVVGQVLHDGYIAVTGLVCVALAAINKLMEDGVKKLAEKAAQMVAGDAAIEAVGLGPEDPLADIGAGIWTAWKLYEIYKIVRVIISTITVIEQTFTKIAEAVHGIVQGIQAVKAFFSSPMPTLDTIKKGIEQRGMEFEKNGSWNPKLGALRVGLLPAS
jgi:uncharacterized protein YukE